MAVQEVPILSGAPGDPGLAMRPRRTTWQRLWRARVAYLMLAPTFILLLVSAYYPAIMGLYRSVFKGRAGLGRQPHPECL